MFHCVDALLIYTKVIKFKIELKIFNDYNNNSIENVLLNINSLKIH